MLLLSMSSIFYFFGNFYDNHSQRLISTYSSVSLITFISGFFGILTPASLFPICLIIFGIGYFFIKDKKNYSFVAFEFKNYSPIIFFVLSYFFVTWISQGTWISLDDTTYHAAIPASWVQNAKIGLTNFTYQTHYPLSGSLFPTFFLTFLRHESIVVINDLFILGMYIFSIQEFCQRNKVNPLYPLMVGALFFLNPDIFKYMRGFSDADILAPVLLVCILNLMDEELIKNKILISICFSILIGTKVIYCLISFPLILFFVYRLFKEAKNLDILLCFFICLLGCFWYLRNFILTGNPLFPAQIAIFKGLFSKEITSKTVLFSLWPTLSPTEKIEFVKGVFGWKAGAYLFNAISIACYINYFFFYKGKKILPLKYFFIGFVLFFIYYFFTPFSGTNETWGLNVNSSRYFIAFYMVGFLLIFTFNQNKWIKNIILLGACVGTLSLLSKYFVLCGILSGLIFYVQYKYSILKNKKVPFEVVLLLSLVVIPLRISKFNHTKNEVIWYLKGINKFEPKNIAIFNNFIIPAYHLFGNDFAHTPIHVDNCGKYFLQMPKMTTENYEYFFPKDPAEFLCDTPSEIHANLKQSNVDLIIFDITPIGKPHPNLALLKSWSEFNSRFEQVYTHEKGEVWRVL